VIKKCFGYLFRGRVSCGTETEFSDAAIAHRLDAHIYQVSGFLQKGPEDIICTVQHLLVHPIFLKAYT
jgi:hypothetical protein